MTQDCILCGAQGPQVRPILVEWREPIGNRFQVIPICHDRTSCRARVEGQGEEWPIADTTRERESA